MGAWAKPPAMLTYLMLVAAGCLAGVMNSVAGGGTFVTLPALILAGVPSMNANASSTVAMAPATLSSLWAFRRDVRRFGPVGLKPMVAVSIVGGIIGGALLLLTPTRMFDEILPWLLLLATLMLIFGPRLRLYLEQKGHRIGPRPVLLGQLVVGIYGGYFGGAVGLIMTALWTLLSELDVKALTPARLMMGAAMNTAAVVLFIAAGAIFWPQTLAVLAGGVVGGYGGARVGRRLPAPVIRAIVITVTAATTVAFFWRAYG